MAQIRSLAWKLSCVVGVARGTKKIRKIYLESCHVAQTVKDLAFLLWLWL